MTVFSRGALAAAAFLVSCAAHQGFAAQSGTSAPSPETREAVVDPVDPSRAPLLPEPSTDVERALRQSLKGARYVAIGSSYAAGPQLPPGKPGAPARCGQSANNYPSLLAAHFQMKLVDRSCSGAMTQHVLGPWGNIAPQIDAVNAQTRLVTLTIGGNDLTYVGNLFNATCAQEMREHAASSTKPPRKCNTVRVPTEADYARDEEQLNAIARQVRERAPEARLVFVQYLQPLPAPGKLCAQTPISPADAEIIRTIGSRLAAITERVAISNNAAVVEMNEISSEHSPCDADPWMIGWPRDYDGKHGLQWHLNLTGMTQTARAIAIELQKGASGLAPRQPAPLSEGVLPDRTSSKAANQPIPVKPAKIPTRPGKPA